VDIIIPEFNHSELTFKCIDSIKRNTPSDLYQITVIDNGSSRDPFDYWVRNNFPEINIVTLPYNMGYVRATNIGIAMSLLTDAEHVLLLNNDTEIPDDREWLQRLIEPMAYVDIGAVGAVSNTVFGQQRRAEPDRKQVLRFPTILENVNVLVGFCMLLRKKAMFEVGWLDERYGPDGNYSDFDYSQRLIKAGWKLAIAESVWVNHVGSVTQKDFDFNSNLARNRAKFEEKWAMA
jgi:GT2 family glycosyltransferase